MVGDHAGILGAVVFVSRFTIIYFWLVFIGFNLCASQHLPILGSQAVLQRKKPVNMIYSDDRAHCSYYACIPCPINSDPQCQSL